MEDCNGFDTPYHNSLSAYSVSLWFKKTRAFTTEAQRAQSREEINKRVGASLAKLLI
jgi:hypothetical protein